MRFTKKDLFFSVVTGLTTGIIAWRVLLFLDKPEFFGYSVMYLVFIMPILWILGVNLGYFLGRWITFFNQFGRFAAIGFTNFAVYSGILNLFIGHTGITRGSWFSVFAAVSFVVAATHSYIWNKYWVFESAESGGGASEFGKFFTVTVLAGLINVVVASGVVNFIDRVFNIRAEGWANVGGILGSAAALLFSFVGYRLIVFKKKSPEPPNVISQI